MEFFTKLSPLMDGLNKITITIQKKGDKLTVGFLPEAASKEVNDKLKMLSLTGTAEDLDNDFFEPILKVSDTVKGVTANVEEVEAELKKLEDQKKGKLEGKKKETEKKPAAKPEHKKPQPEKAESEEKPEEEEKEVQATMFE